MKILGKYPSLRLRRIRKSSWIRRLVSENNLSVNDLILPIFIREGINKVETIKSMPGINRYTVDRIDQADYERRGRAYAGLGWKVAQVMYFNPIFDVKIFKNPSYSIMLDRRVFSNLLKF